MPWESHGHTEPTTIPHLDLGFLHSPHYILPREPFCLLSVTSLTRPPLSPLPLTPVVDRRETPPTCRHCRYFGVDHCEIKICTASTERRLGPNLSVAASWKNFRVCWRVAISSLASGNLRLRRSGMKYVPIRLVRVLLLTST